MTVYEMAEHYYPKLWSKKRLEALVAAGRLTKAELKKLTTESETKDE